MVMVGTTEYRSLFYLASYYGFFFSIHGNTPSTRLTMTNHFNDPSLFADVGEKQSSEAMCEDGVLIRHPMVSSR